MARKLRKAPDADGELAKLVAWYEDSVTATFDARRLAERDRDYYDNKQWTSDEEQKLKERGQAPIVINRIKPKIDFLLGTERQQRADPHAFPRNPDDDSAAEAATDALRYVADCNDFDQVRSDAFENILIEGTGAAVVEVDEKGKIKTTRVPWDRFYYDPHSRYRDLSDAIYMGVVTWLDSGQVKARWPEGGEEVWAASFEDEVSTTYGDRPKSMWIDSNRKRIKVCECYYDEGAGWKRAVYAKGGWLEKPADSPYVNEDGDPINPIIAVSAHVDRDNNRYGVVRQLIGVQDEINKRRSKALHLISSRQFKAERGAVDDLARAKKELAKPDGIVEVNPGLEFDLIDTADMAQGNMALLQEAKAEIDAVGANAALQGKQQGDASGRALQSRQQSGLVELGPVFDSLRHWQRLVFRQMWYRIKQYWKAPMWVRVTDDEQSPKYVGLNQPMMQGDSALEDLKRKNDPRAMQFEQIWNGVKSSPNPVAALMQANLPPDLLQQIVQNDVSKMDMDIIIADAPDTVNLQGEQFELLSQMYQASLQSPDPKDHIPFELVLEASSLRGKQKLLAKLKGEDDEQAKQQQMQQAQEQQAYQKAAADAELAIKQSEARLKNAQAVKTEQEAKVVAPEQQGVSTALPEAQIKADADLQKAHMSGQFELQKTAMQQDGETQRHAMSLHADSVKNMGDAALTVREQDMRAEQAEAPEE